MTLPRALLLLLLLHSWDVDLVARLQSLSAGSAAHRSCSIEVLESAHAQAFLAPMGGS